MSDRPTQLVWFKRDLRVTDHAPLVEAAARGPCLCLYVYEPEVRESETFDAGHARFIDESLVELDDALRARGAFLAYRRGEMTAVLEALLREQPFETIWSHEETGDAVTYARDRRVADWARSRGVAWHEIPGNGVVRRLASRDGWARRWAGRMAREPLAAPERIASPRGLDPGAREPAPPARPEAQPGGAAQGAALLTSFLAARGVGYARAMSSPVTAWDGCSRLSPHLAWGTLSVREVHRATAARRAEVRAARGAGEDVDARWAGSLKAFDERLRWHCHFMQKLEDEPAIEHRNMSRAYDGLREGDFDEARFAAWCEGLTGFPMVDACMRALHSAGWVNFRMRAMLASFAAYQLWLHWRPSALHLARLFVDFEPGIHFSQIQMQSGVTGINTFRIYSPIKQALDQDPKGVFIRRYCPELEGVPDAYIAQPERMPGDVQRAAGCIIGRDYPAPIVAHGEAYRLARQRMYAVKGSAGARSEAQRVATRHGSRRSPRPRRRRDRAPA